MRRLIKRAGGVAVIGLGATLLPLLAAGPASAVPGPQPAPTVTPNPVATNTSNFTLSNGTCDGTSGNGWRVQTFIVNVGVNIGSLAFDQGGTFDRVGTDRDNSNGTIASPLFKGTVPGTGYFPANSPAGLINPADLSSFNFSDPAWVLTDGPYQIGYACINGESAVSQWWSQTVTIDTTPGGGTSFLAVGLAAGAPTATGATSGNGTCTVAFTPGASNPAATSFTAKATPTGGGATVAQSGSGSPITITGLANFTAHDVVVTATNSVGESAASNTVTCTPSFTRPGVTNLAAAVSGPGDTSATLTWVEPTGDAPTSYRIEVAGPTPGTFTTPAPATTYELPDLAVGSYTATVTPLHSTQPDGDPASVTFSITPVFVPPPDPCAPPRGLLSGLLWNLGLGPLAVSLCRAGL